MHLYVHDFRMLCHHTVQHPGVCDLRWQVQHRASWRRVGHMGNVVCRMADLHHYPHLHHCFGCVPL